jgi:hypothetical protein
MKKDGLTYKIVYLLILFGIIIHLVGAHPLENEWIMCSADNNTHLENVNISEDCHFQHEKNILTVCSNCKSDIILEHQDEFYSNYKNSEKRILPVSLMIYIPEIENNILFSHYISINLVEIELLPLLQKNTVSLLI